MSPSGAWLPLQVANPAGNVAFGGKLPLKEAKSTKNATSKGVSAPGGSRAQDVRGGLPANAGLDAARSGEEEKRKEGKRAAERTIVLVLLNIFPNFARPKFPYQ